MNYNRHQIVFIFIQKFNPILNYLHLFLPLLALPKYFFFVTPTTKLRKAACTISLIQSSALKTINDKIFYMVKHR